MSRRSVPAPDPIWEDPPPSVTRQRGPRMKYLGTCAALIERTGEWARIEVVANKNTAAAMTSRIAHSRRRPWTGHVWDARYAEQPDGSYAVYVRHLSQNPPEPGDAA